MERDLPTSTYIKIAILIFIIPIVIIVTLLNGENIINGISSTFQEITHNNKIKNTEITQQNYKEIYNIINNSTELTLQEKANFNKNYILFGKTIIGYKVKDVIKEINI